MRYYAVGESPTSRDGGLVPQGEEKYGYDKHIRVRCFDAIGSWTDVYITAMVYPAPAWKVLEMAAGESCGYTPSMCILCCALSYCTKCIDCAFFVYELWQFHCAQALS